MLQPNQDRCAIGRRSDAKQKMVQAARQLIRERALHSPAPYEAVRTVLVSQAVSVSPKTSGRKGS